MTKNIIFDLGGVLIDWNPRYMYRKIFFEESKMEWFLENVCTFEWNEEQDGGRSIAEANKLVIDKYPEWTEEIEAFYGRWPEMLGGPIESTVEILNQVQQQKNYRLFALTNWSHETFPIAQERYAFLQYFEDIVVSGTEKLKKPDPAIYKLLLDRNELLAEECLFIDDNKRNAEAARKMGIETIHFNNASQLAFLIQ